MFGRIAVGAELVVAVGAGLGPYVEGAGLGIDEPVGVLEGWPVGAGDGCPLMEGRYVAVGASVGA